MKTLSTAFRRMALIGATIICGAIDTPAAQSATDPRFDWFHKAKAGMFIHWGPYSIAAGEWQGKRGTRDAHLMNEFRIPLADYTKLAGTFKPLQFDADAWAKLAKDAGLQYIVYVSKHHDGFAMFDSASSRYDMMDATPFQRDPLKELAAACQKYQLKLCVYYSLGRDWSVPGIPRGGRRCNDWDFPHPSANAQRDYIENKVKPQLRELLTQYGPLGAVWFDTPDQITATHSKDLRKFILALQPDCLINARIGNHQGDYDIHEQKIPETAIHRPWEACLTLNRRWGYDRNDHSWKSPEMIVRCLVDVASKGGNFLINIGPTGEGVVPAPSVERLHSLGEWLAVNGESIHGTKASRIPSADRQGVVFQEINPDGSEKSLDASGAPESHDAALPRGWRSTSKPGIIYLHLFDRPANGWFRLTGLHEKVTSVTMLADPQGRAMAFQQTGNDFSIQLLEGIWDPRATVLKLETAAPSARQSDEEPTADLSQWRIEQVAGGTVKTIGGELEILDHGGCTVWYRPRLIAPIEIEYQVTVVAEGGPNDRVSDVNCFWMASEADAQGGDPPELRKRNGKFSEYDSLLTYYVGMGGNNNSTTRFRRYDGTPSRPLLPEHDLRIPEVLLSPNATYQIRLVARDGQAEFWRDGKRIFLFRDPQPLKSGWFGFRTVNSHLRIKGFRTGPPSEEKKNPS